VNGSVTPETPTDQKCGHCRLFFSKNGLPPHEENCPLKGRDLVVVPVEEADALEASTDPREAVDRDPEALADAKDDVTEAVEAATPTVVGEEQGEPVTPDGGAVLDPPEPEASDDEECCPSCGSTDYFDPDDLEDAALERDPELATWDRACHPCSTDDQGRLSYPVEVWNVAN
jgi:hypothetical protein